MHEIDSKPSFVIIRVLVHATDTVALAEMGHLCYHTLSTEYKYMYAVKM
jgi:hypothetical protein